MKHAAEHRRDEHADKVDHDRAKNRGIPDAKEGTPMLNLLWAVAALFVVMWIFGFTFHVAAGGLIQLLLVLAVVAVLVRIILGRRIA